MAPPKSPEGWAIRASLMLRQVLEADRFPVDVERLALEWSKVLDPKAPITRVRAKPLEGFEGALVDGRNRGKGWGIVYDAGMRSEGRRRFTIAHEFGHFIMHRDEAPQGGFQCRQEDLAAWDHDRSPQETEANRFAAGVLMPFDDFRAQVPARALVGLEKLGELARERYGVSLTACALRWLEHTERRAILVVSRDGFVLWAKPSGPAYRSGIFLRTRSGPPIDVPEASPLASGDPFLASGEVVRHPAGVWFDEPVREEVIVADRYDLGLSLLTLDGGAARTDHVEENEPDVVDLIGRRG